MGYADHLPDPSEDWERLQKELCEYLDEYELFLKNIKQLSKSTIDKKCGHLNSFIEYICLHHPVAGFEDIKYAWCSSGFSSYSKWSLDEEINTKTSRNYIRDFFVFIYENYGVANLKLLEKLKTTR